jgi:hypothetical protein
MMGSALATTRLSTETAGEALGEARGGGEALERPNVVGDVIS